MTSIVIIGGHGKVALQLSTLLTTEGHSVTSIIRNPDHAADVAATGATPSVLDVENSTTAAIADALRGHDAVVWSAGPGEEARNALMRWTVTRPSGRWTRRRRPASGAM
ncbi:UPF0659 protein C216.03 [Arthrobacter sp. Hiyo4]|nr:UPF0659 protein C216.03 [Arthrobacter sp. Hiyo4]